MSTTPGAPAQVHPGKGLGFIGRSPCSWSSPELPSHSCGRANHAAALGSSLHYVLSLLRHYPRAFPSISTVYSPASPVTAPVLVVLDSNGIRLRFDGPDQRLRLIEVVDFQKCRLTYNSGELTRTGAAAGGPTCKSIYNKLFGPTYPGEYLENQGLYVLSYPGVAFSFPVDAKTWKEDVDFVSLLSSSNAQPACSMAIFTGRSWAEARDTLFAYQFQTPRIPTANINNARLSVANDDVELVKIHDGNTVEIVRRHSPPFWITLHSTTPQDLVSELGPPSAIYRKSDHRLSIHRARSASGHQPHDEADDTEPDEVPSDDDEDLSDVSATSSSDCFYNYFNHGLDVFVSASSSSAHPVATKIILHGNVPGSYMFQRYRRCRWKIELAPSLKHQSDLSLDSEQTFEEVLPRLRERFGGGQKPMPLNRMSDSPSSSCELLGGWEDGDDRLDSNIRGDTKGVAGRQETAFGTSGSVAPFSVNLGVEETDRYGKSELYGFPGFIFEVMKNKTIDILTVF